MKNLKRETPPDDWHDLDNDKLDNRGGHGRGFGSNGVSRNYLGRLDTFARLVKEKSLLWQPWRISTYHVVLSETTTIK
jgi:hypothetical protein